MAMGTGNVNSKRQCLSVSSFIKLIFVGTFLCTLLMANYNWIPIAEGRRELSNVTFKVQERVKNVTKAEREERARLKTVNMVLKAPVTKYINKTNDYRGGDRRPNVTEYYAKDDTSYYVGTKYIKHKLLNENGPRLSPKQRAQLVKERCQTFLKENDLRLNPNARHIYDNKSILVSRLYNISICYNYKVASTNTKRLLYALDHSLSDIMKRITISAARRNARSCARTFHQIMSDKPRINIMMVREPLERLLSGHRDNRAFQVSSFKKYLQLTLDQGIKNMDGHIYPYFEHCRPCEMQYDFVVLQNHFNDDIKIVLQEIGAARKVSVPERNKTGYDFVSSDKLLQQYFKNIPNDMVHKLWEKYYKDYYMFGFPYPAHLMN